MYSSLNNKYIVSKLWQTISYFFGNSTLWNEKQRIQDSFTSMQPPEMHKGHLNERQHFSSQSYT